MRVDKVRKLSLIGLLSLAFAMPVVGGTCNAAAKADLVNMKPTYRDVVVADVKNDDGTLHHL